MYTTDVERNTYSSDRCPFFRLDNSEPGYDDRIELKVYGITCPGTQITHDLVELLDRKLVMKSGIKYFISYIVSRKMVV